MGASFVGSRSYLDEILTLDPERDHQRIVHLDACFEFPFDTTRALEFALFRTFCVPSVSALLEKTGEFLVRTQKRYDDTDLIVSELMEWGYDSERGRRALRRMNQLHGRFTIANDDFLYVLSTFIYEPIRWNHRWGWRRMSDHEKRAQFHFWCAVGRHMNIKAIPDDYGAFERFNIEYERAHFRWTESNQRIGSATRELFAGWFARPLRPLVRQAIYALMDEPVRSAFGFPRPLPGMRACVDGTMKLRARVLRWLPARSQPRLRTALRHPSYPAGYTIEQLGPP